jgi:ADP-ribose pyrophosphatase
VSQENLRDTAEEATVSLRETVYTGAVWDVVRETFDYGDGELTRDFVNHTGASAVVALNDNDEVLLLRQYRHPVRSRNWELPAGLLDQPGEDPRECAIRELAEEASYQAGQWTHMTTLNVSPGGSNELIHIFLARDLSPVTHDYVRTGEEADLEVAFWPLGDAVQAALNGHIRNQISVTGLLFAHLWHERH